MKYNYTPVVKTQKNNPFWKLNSRDKASLEKELLDRLLWINQLGASADSKDQEFYATIALTKSREFFGSAPHYGNQANTGLAALAGAVDKLRRGDLSQKQFNNIQPVLDALHKGYPHHWSAVEFEEITQVSVTTPLDKLFEIVDG
jgi:hypothetical protein